MDDTGARILQAAGPVFAERGFRAATVRDICRRAGVNLASVNYHFGDKQKLYIETVRYAHRLRVEQVPLPKWPEDAAPRAKLAVFVRTMMSRMLGSDAQPWQHRLLMREVLDPTEACRQMVHDYFRPHEKILRSILDEMLPPGIAKPRRQQVAFSIIGQCLFYRFAGNVVSLLVDEDTLAADFSPEQLAEHIIDFSLAALGASPPLSAPRPSTDGNGAERFDDSGDSRDETAAARIAGRDTTALPAEDFDKDDRHD